MSDRPDLDRRIERLEAALRERDKLAEVIANAEPDETVGSLKVYEPREGYSAQWAGDFARALLEPASPARRCAVCGVAEHDAHYAGGEGGKAPFVHPFTPASPEGGDAK